ncbi:DUF424 family protein [Nanoarchaeota archaeon NZ13-N]|nr:MAG: DUF424 family protein [Nanoarchaeota archaeon NZ13-N]
MIFLKKIESKDGLILILCDKDLYGKEFSEGEVVISINDFYIGEEVNEVEPSILEEAIMINAIGKEAIDILIKNSILKDDDIGEVRYVKGVPYIFIVKDEV